jgi:uncharacterized protein (TIGR02246 family)
MTILFTIAVLAMFAIPAQADDKADIEALIKEYNRLEEMSDMAGQAKLMTPDRIWIGGTAGRRTNQDLNMKIQQAGLDRSKKRSPATALHDVRDLIIRVYGDAAIASFYWYQSLILTPDQEGPNPSTVLIHSLFLVKQDGSWKIAYSHSSPLHPSNQ